MKPASKTLTGLAAAAVLGLGLTGTAHAGGYSSYYVVEKHTSYHDNGYNDYDRGYRDGHYDHHAYHHHDTKYYVIKQQPRYYVIQKRYNHCDY